MGRHAKARGSAMAPYRIDITLPGIGVHVGLPDDRVRISTGTRDLAERDRMVKCIRELYRFSKWEVLRAILDGRISLAEATKALELGGAGIEVLVAASTQAASKPFGPKPIAEILVEHLVAPTRSRVKRTGGGVQKQEQMVLRFALWLEDTLGVRATMEHLVPDVINKWLDSLVNLSTSEPLNDATRQRYRMAISGLCTRAVTLGYLSKHPMRGTNEVIRYHPNAHRIPDFFFAERLYDSYFDAVRRFDAELVVFFKIMAHCGTDLHETLVLEGCGINMSEAQVTTVTTSRLKTKGHGARPRDIPVAAEIVNDHLIEHFSRVPYRAYEQVFRNLEWSRGQSGASCYRVRRAHEFAASEIGHGTSTLTGHAVDARDVFRLKDLRHVSAILWAKAGDSLPVIMRRMGHTSIDQTEKYASYTLDLAEQVASVTAARDVLDRVRK